MDDLTSKPTPDPTVLTTAQLVRAVGAERDYADGKIAVLEERLRGIDRATEVLNETVNRTPTDIQKEVTHLRELSEEKFMSVETQFKERDTRSERESRDNKVAVDAAFAAQKEAAAKQDEGNQKAIDKSERATNDSIAKLGELFTTTTNGLKERVSALDLAITALQSNSAGRTTETESVAARTASIRATIIIGLTVATLVLGVIVFITNSMSSPG